MPSSSAPDKASLPIIDIEPYLPSKCEQFTDQDREKTAKAFHEACRDIGFLYLKVDSLISADELQGALDAGREFFHLPQEEKEEILLTKSDGARGYQRMHQNVTQGKADHHEGIDFYAPSPYGPQDSKKPLGGENQWPRNPTSLRPRMETWIDKTKILGKAVMHAMCDGLGMTPEEWTEMWALNDNSFWSMRIIGYPALPPGQDGISCGEHKDYGCLTFLHADDCPGALQVLAKSGEWINADMVPGTVVVNIGAMWERWTGGLYPATLHRVVHLAPTFRVSIPFFFEPNFDAPIKLLPAAKRTAEAEGRKVIEPTDGITYGDFLLSKVTSNFKY